jgi:hypothetical protein
VGVKGGNPAKSALAWLPGGLTSRSAQVLGLWVGIACAVASIAVYERSGYSHRMLVLWLAGLVVLAAFFASRSRALPKIALLDLALPAGLLALVSPLYVAALYRWPVQVNSDEVAVMGVSKVYATLPGADPFGVSYYLSRPALLFIGWGKLGNLLGGIDLFHMRLLHALCGLLVVALSYALFRQLLPRWWAAFATLLVATSHAFFMISRLAMRENTAVLAEVLALVLLLWGLRTDHELATFLGGISAGLGFYVYFPARITFPIWLLFLVGVALLFRSRFSRRRLAELGAIALAGLVLIAAPLTIAESRIPPGDTEPNKETLLIYDQAREVQRAWVFESTQWGGYEKNAKWGLTAFNNEVEDHGWIYANVGHGFVDPLTGILLWLGVAVVGVGLWRRRDDEGAFLMLGGFLALWLAFALAINKAPNYTRLLIVVPFVAYLATQGTRWLADRWRSIRFVPAAIVGTIGAAIVVWNLAIAWDFIQHGREFGEPIGSTGRYVQSHRDTPGIHFYISTPNDQVGDLSYFTFGPSEDRLRIFVRDQGQVVNHIDPTQLPGYAAKPPFALFMRRGVWERSAEALSASYPQGRLRNVVPEGTHVVLEVPG